MIEVIPPDFRSNEDLAESVQDNYPPPHYDYKDFYLKTGGFLS